MVFKILKMLIKKNIHPFVYLDGQTGVYATIFVENLYECV